MGMLRDFPFKMLHEVRVGITASPTNGLEQCSKPWLATGAQNRQEVWAGNGPTGGHCGLSHGHV